MHGNQIERKWEYTDFILKMANAGDTDLLLQHLGSWRRRMVSLAFGDFQDSLGYAVSPDLKYQNKQEKDTENANEF